MKKLFFTFNIALLVLSFTFVSCGKRCLDPAANNSTEKGDCIYPSDEFQGVYSMTCNCTPQTGTGSGSAINKTFDLELAKVDDDEVAVKNLQGCGGSVNSLLVVKSYSSNIVGLNSTCDGSAYNISGTMNLVPSTGDLSISYNMSGVGAGVTWYTCTASGKRK